MTQKPNIILVCDWLFDLEIVTWITTFECLTPQLQIFNFKTLSSAYRKAIYIQNFSVVLGRKVIRNEVEFESSTCQFGLVLRLQTSHKILMNINMPTLLICWPISAFLASSAASSGLNGISSPFANSSLASLAFSRGCVREISSPITSSAILLPTSRQKCSVPQCTG